MRALTQEQKKLLRQWFKENYKGGYKFDMVDSIDTDTYEKIEMIHPTEIHYRNCNAFLEKLADKYVDPHRPIWEI